MFQLDETGRREQPAPRLQIVISAITRAVPALAVIAAWIGTEQHATGFQAAVQLLQNPRQFLQPGDVLRSEIDGLGVMEATLVAET